MLNLFKKQKPQQAFTESIALTNSMKALVSATRCPACGQLTLGVVRAEQGTKAFETEVQCSNCLFTGLSNSTGFQFNQVNSKGRAVK
jgi:predicted RNA-binding Zn-ribbon protein involved in translation (DUF1610 family)